MNSDIPNIGRSSPAASTSSCTDRAATPSPLLRNCHPMGRSTPLSSLCEGIVFDGNNNKNSSSQRQQDQKRRSNRREYKRKHVTYDFEEIDRSSTSTFDPVQLARPMNIIVNSVEESDNGQQSLPKKATIVSANDDHISTDVVFNEEEEKRRRGSSSQTSSIRITSAPLGYADTNVSILLHKSMTELTIYRIMTMANVKFMTFLWIHFGALTIFIGFLILT